MNRRDDGGSHGAAAACPVCGATGARCFVVVDGKRYFRCDNCQARFLDPAARLSAGEEVEEYRRHRNDPADPGYRRFLARLSEPLQARIAPSATGLDYGCGPGPALAAMLRDAGHAVVLYDPFFHPDPEPVPDSYDFITCTEVIEHFHDPMDSFDHLDRLLRPGGLLAVMTCFQTDDRRFANWHYRRDPTHVVFYREATIRHVAAMRRWQCEIPAKDIAFLRKAGAGTRRPGGRRCDMPG